MTNVTLTKQRVSVFKNENGYKSISIGVSSKDKDGNREYVNVPVHIPKTLSEKAEGLETGDLIDASGFLSNVPTRDGGRKVSIVLQELTAVEKAE